MFYYDVPCLKKINHNVLAKAVVPGSKSITNRALLLAAMSEGTSRVSNCLTSDDAVHFLECLKTLGFPVEESSETGLGRTVAITGFGGEIPCKKAEIYVGSAGTAARFLVAMLAFSDGEYTVASSEQMKKRPMQPLIDALRNAGAEVVCQEEEGHFPMHIVGARKRGTLPDHFNVNIEKSSQFLSAMLIAAGTLQKKAVIDVEGSHGLSYADLTVQMMKTFGVTADKQTIDGKIRYIFSGKDCYKALDYSVEPDMSAAAYFYALAAVLGTGIIVKSVHGHMMQGDTEFLKVLERMGCIIEATDKYKGKHSDKSSEQSKEDRINDVWNEEIAVFGPENGNLKGGFTIDMSAFSDQALTLAAIAPYADAPITITGIGHIRLQECDRIKAIADNLKVLGITVDEKEDAVTIYPGTPKGCEIETYDDHRVAMAFTLTGLRTEGVRIMNPECCKKTFAEYFDILEQTLKQIRIS